MLERLDRFPDPWGQLHDITGHYRRQYTKRENERLRKLEKRAAGGKDTDALKQLNEALAERAERRGTTPQEELARLKHGDS